MKTLFTLLIFFAYTTAVAQTLTPWLDDMNSVSQPGDQWRLITGQGNTGSHNGEMCYNVVGNYLDNEFYSFESDTLDLLLWSQVNVEFTIASNLRNSDQFAFYYYDGATASWSGYDISGLVGTYQVTIPSTARLLSFDLSTFSNGNLNGKYAHVDQIILSDPATPLPVELIGFEGREHNGYNHLHWITASESNSNYFKVEWSGDSYEWLPIGLVPAAGMSNMNLEYTFRHDDFINGVNYYRLTQYDFDGQFEIFEIIAIDNTKKQKHIVKYVSLSGQEIDPSTTTGLVLGIYDDGTIIRLYLR